MDIPNTKYRTSQVPLTSDSNHAIIAWIHRRSLLTNQCCHEQTNVNIQDRSSRPTDRPLPSSQWRPLWSRLAILLAIFSVITALTVRSLPGQLGGALSPSHGRRATGSPLADGKFTPRTSRIHRRIPSLAHSGVYLGVSIFDVPPYMASLDRFEHLIRKRVAIVGLGRSMGGSASSLPWTWLQEIKNHGSVPLITWEPRNSDPGTDQTLYSLANIAKGRDDREINGWAREIRTWGRPVLIRFAHEMNGSWYPWGRQPKAFVAAWRHIHNVFVSDGATNAQWVWCPNTQWDAASRFNAYYPGNSYVDWIALDAYNQPTNGTWMSLYQLLNLDSSYLAITSLTSKPLMIAETSSSEARVFPGYGNQSKAHWITEAFTKDIPSMRRIRAIVWLNENLQGPGRCCDWRIQSSPSASRAFTQAVASRRYLSRYP